MHANDCAAESKDVENTLAQQRIKLLLKRDFIDKGYLSLFISIRSLIPIRHMGALSPQFLGRCWDSRR